MNPIVRRICRGLPWNKRVQEARARAREAQAMYEQAKAERRVIRKHTAAITAEVELNDWTLTAKRIFSGRGRAS